MKSLALPFRRVLTGFLAGLCLAASLSAQPASASDETASRADRFWQGRAKIDNPAEIYLATRQLLLAGRPFEADQLAKEDGRRFAEAPETSLARAEAALALGNLHAALTEIQALLNGPHRSAQLIALVVRWELLTRASVPQPRALIDRMLTEAGNFPEYHLHAADWAERGGDLAFSREQLRLYLAAPSSGERSAEVTAAVRSYLAWVQSFPDEPVREIAERVELPLHLAPLPMVELSLNGRPPVLCIVDTGATHVVIDATYAEEELRLPAGPVIDAVSSATGNTRLTGTSLTSLSAPGLRIGPLRAGLGDLRSRFSEATRYAATDQEKALAAQLVRVRAIVGAEVLAKNRVLWFDTVKGRLVIARDFKTLGAGPATTEGDFVDDLSYLNFDLANEGNRPGLALLDTGANHTLSLDAAWVRANGLNARIRPSPVTSLGMAGAAGSPGEITVNRVRFWPPSDNFSFSATKGPTPLFNSTPRFDHPVCGAVIGWEALQAFAPIFDYERRRVHLYSPTPAPTPEPR